MTETKVRVKVRKKDGSIEDFERDKTFNSILGATATPDQASEITKEVEQWVISSTLETVTTGEIRNKVIELLNERNPSAASLYEQFDRDK